MNENEVSKLFVRKVAAWAAVKMKLRIFEAASLKDPEGSFHFRDFHPSSIGKWVLADTDIVDRARETCQSNDFIQFLEVEMDEDDRWRRYFVHCVGAMILATPWWEKNRPRFRHGMSKFRNLRNVMEG